ncbi:MAG TPA: carboxypeptidase-like regulatory domain-containing protein, partial [Gemmatimonadaceae bacterium]|nr:carboxypeptidase-like regulatory domain-containing protein [Gemmatimonadaceae bacterium]
MARLTVAIAGACIATAGGAGAQASRPAHTVTVFVVDSASGDPVEAAQVSARRSGVLMLTGTNGLAQFQLVAPGVDTIRVRRMGYTPLAYAVATVPRGSTELEFDLQAVALTLTGVEVVATRLERLVSAGFYDRQARYKGVFITPEQLAGINATKTSDVLIYAPGVRLSQHGTGSRTVRLRRAENCPPVVYVDGRQFMVERASVPTRIVVRGVVSTVMRAPEPLGEGIDRVPATALA